MNNHFLLSSEFFFSANDAIHTYIAGRLCLVTKKVVLLAALLTISSQGVIAQGTLTNGWTHTGTISPIGDSDSWTFDASTGDRIVIRVGEITQTGSFTPRIRLQNPSAVQIGQASGAVAAEISIAATNTGTFTVIVDDVVGTSATGTYRLTLAKTPGTIFVAPGDEGGPLVNGTMHIGTIELGDLDVWTTTANAGDTIVVRMGELTNGSSLTPAVWLYGPNGALLDSYGASSVAAEISFRATNSGPFTVVVGDFSAFYTGSGGYRLTLGKTGEAIAVSVGDEGGSLTNGVMHTGTLEAGDMDVWSLTANSGESIVLRMGELTNGSSLTPAIWLYGPNGALLGAYGASGAAAEVSARATNSGTFTVMVADFSSFYTGSGNYRLTLAKTGSPIVISAGDEGGPLTNGVMHTGIIDVGDADLWSFTASSGDSIVVRMGELTNTLTPAIWLYGPNGALLMAYGASSVAAEVAVRATNSGTFTVVVADFTGFYVGSGGYRLTLAKTGAAIVVSPGDESGPLTNGLTYTGTIDLGDADIWAFAANSGESITVRMGEVVAGSALQPHLRLYGPDGALLSTYRDSEVAAEVSFRATNSGTFTVISADFSSGYSGAGTYRLSLAKTGDPILISPGDEGGTLTNGFMHLGTLDPGEVDAWSLTAVTGDSIVLRMGELVSGSALTPGLWLYGPNGVLLNAYGASAAAAEISVRATNSGMFTVVAADFSDFYTGSGGYRLTLAQTRAAIVVSPGDQGGSLSGSDTYDGMLDLGDLDLFHFTACAGDILSLRLDELVVSSPLTPWVRLYTRDGVLMRSVSGAATAQTVVLATNSGVFTVVASDFSGFYTGSGTYRLTVNGLSDGLKLCTPLILGTNVNVRAIGGMTNAMFRLYTTTDIATPAALWAPIFTNQFDSFGTFSFTNFFDRAELHRFFRVLQLAP